MEPVPTLASSLAREVDRLASDRYRTPVAWLMEAAGWQVARLCRGRAAVLCGQGNNGGDGLAAARHLHRWGRLASVSCVDAAALAGAAAAEAGALMALGVEIESEPRFGGADTVVDALLGTGLSRAPGGRLREWIEAANAGGRPVLAVDLPSGLAADDGRTPGECVRAALTVTLGLPKPGLLLGRGREVAGEVWVADIGIPNEAYADLGVPVPASLFAVADRFRLHPAEPR